MNNLKKLTAVVIISSLALFSCGKKEEISNTCDLTAELMTFQQQASAYSANQTRNSCNNLKQSAIDLLKKAEGCTGVAKDGILAATNVWKDIDCSGVK